jgi:hypothetical protein
MIFLARLILCLAYTLRKDKVLKNIINTIDKVHGLGFGLMAVLPESPMKPQHHENIRQG